MKTTALIYSLMLFAAASPASPLEGLTDLEGNASSWSTMKDRLLVSLWATWCSECKKKLAQELPEFDRRPNVAVLAVNTEKDLARVKHFVEKEQVKLPVLVDSHKRLRQTLKAFSVPHWAVYARAGDTWTLVDTAPAFEMARIEAALGRRL